MSKRQYRAAVLVAVAGLVAVVAGASPSAAAAPAARPEAGNKPAVVKAATGTNVDRIVNLQYDQCLFTGSPLPGVQLGITMCGTATSQQWAPLQVNGNIYVFTETTTSLCMDVLGGANALGQPVQQGTCSFGSTQQWLRTAVTVNGVPWETFKNVATSLCLDTVAGPFSGLMLWTCQGNGAQLWRVVPAADLRQLLNKQYDQCVDVPGADPFAQTQLTINTCGTTAAQQWTSVQVDANVYTFVNANNGLCLDVLGGSTTLRQPVQQAVCSGATRQQWRRTPVTVSGVVWQTYTNVNTNLCLDTVGAEFTGLMQWTCQGNDAQLWQAIPALTAVLDASHLVGVQTTASGAQGSKVNVVAPCPPGMKVLSAGAGSAPLGDLSPSADGTSVVASGFVNNPPFTVFAQARCLPAAELAGVLTAVTSLTDQRRPQNILTLESATAACPAGMTVIGGGGSASQIHSPGGSSISVDGPASDRPGWTFTGWIARGETLFVRALCAPLPTRTTTVISRVAIPPGQSRGATADCPADHPLLSGGASINDNAHNSFIYVNDASNTSAWFAAASVGVETSDAVLTVTAVCL